MPDRDGIDLYGVKDSEYRMYEESRENKRRGIKKSAYYHRFFEGYAEIYTDLPDGGRKLKRMYAAPWKVLKGTRREWIGRKLFYALMLAAAVILFAFAGTRNVRCNTVWYGGMAGGIVTVLFLLCAVACIRYLRCRRRMTLYEMKSSGGFFRKICASAAVGAAVLTLIAFLSGDYTVGILYLICAGILAILFYMESRAVYEDEKNPLEVPPEATYIR